MKAALVVPIPPLTADELPRHAGNEDQRGGKAAGNNTIQS